MSFSGGGQRETGHETTQGDTRGLTTYNYQPYAGQIVGGLYPGMMDIYSQLMNEYQQGGFGATPEEQQILTQTGAQAGQYGTAGPYAQAAQQYLQPTMGAGWMQQLDPYYTAQQQLIQGAIPGEEEAFWQSMKRQMGPAWGNSGRAQNAVAEAYGNLKLQQSQNLANLEAQRAQAAQTGMQWTGQNAQTYADLTNPYAWGQQKLSWAGMPQNITTQRAQQASSAIQPWSTQLAGLATLGYQYPQSVSQEEQMRSRTSSEKKSGGGSGGASCCFIFMEGDLLMSDVRKYRDTFYPKCGLVGKGYRILAAKLVPMMRKNSFIKKLVKTTMLYPLAYRAKYYYKKNPLAYFFIPIELFWCRLVWPTLGLLPMEQYSWAKYYGLKCQFEIPKEV